jgi:hypothetical protein
MAGAPVGETDATLLTLKTRSDGPVWSEQFREPSVVDRPQAILHGALESLVTEHMRMASFRRGI